MKDILGFIGSIIPREEVKRRFMGIIREAPRVSSFLLNSFLKKSKTFEYNLKFLV